MSFRILTINPGSTSTKIALFEDEEQIFVKTLRHSTQEINAFPTIASQFSFRKELILKELKEANMDVMTLNAIVGRGGLVRPIESGVYEVNDQLIHDLENPTAGEHASNLGGLIAHDLVKSINNGAKAYIADPVVVDELEPVARYSGHPAIQRVSIFHALNQKAIARTYAKEIGKKYEDLNLIVAHLGGGVSVGAHSKGRVIDVNNALNGDGPFSPERSGGLPTSALVDICYNSGKTIGEVKKMLCGEGGLVAYINSNNVQEIVEELIPAHPEYKMPLDAMSYQIAKEIGAMAAVLDGKVDAILLTGGIVWNEPVNDYIIPKVSFIAPIKLYPGEDEMRALAMNGLMILKGEIKAKTY
ncbi:butyrate kinase [Odoribacter sp. OttesenSCG-928-J03]|nr:butyrate kinase [Odoribacter sp. OttesenSCG-928-J03]MDL2331198.1 butyrate kinase [Odoribacter sp. OttesenSCG-928-A06]